MAASHDRKVHPMLRRLLALGSGTLVLVLIAVALTSNLDGREHDTVLVESAGDAEHSAFRSQVRLWSGSKLREVVGQLAETVEDLGKKLLEMPVEGPSGPPGPPGPRGFTVCSSRLPRSHSASVRRSR